MMESEYKVIRDELDMDLRKKSTCPSSKANTMYDQLRLKYSLCSIGEGVFYLRAKPHQRT